MEDREKYLIFNINGKEYIKTKLVSLGERVFQEYSCIDIESPNIVYIELKTQLLVEDWATYIELREKYAIDKNFLRTGNLVLRANFSEIEEKKFINKLYNEISKNPELAKEKIIRHIKSQNIYYSINTEDGEVTIGGYIPNKGFFSTDLIAEYIYRNETKEIQKLFFHDVDELMKNATEKFSHIFEKRGISDPKKWIHDKLFMYGKIPYCIDRELAGSGLRSKSGQIRFNSLRVASRNKILRTHENVHNLTGVRNAEGSCGLLVTKKERNTDGQVLWNESGRALNEGGTEYLTEILVGKASSYEVETFTAKEMAKIVGKDIFIESMLFQDPKLLADKFNEKTGNKAAYHELVAKLDEYHFLDNEIRNLNTTCNSPQEELEQLFHQRDQNLYEAQKCLRDALINPIKKSSTLSSKWITAEINFWKYIVANMKKMQIVKSDDPCDYIFKDNIKKAIKERIAAISLFQDKDNNDRDITM